MSEPTTGGFQCGICGKWVLPFSTHYCAGPPTIGVFTPIAQPQVGWTCPSCGRGLAPWVSVCPHPPRSETAANASGV